MKIKITCLICLIFSFIGCKQSADLYHISDEMDKVLTDYIDRHNKDSIISLYFFHVEDRTYFDIEHCPFYQKTLVDGAFIYKNKLITYFIESKNTEAINLVDTTFTKDKCLLKHYKSWDDVNWEYDGNPDREIYFVKTPNSIIRIQASDIKYEEKAVDTIGIRSITINQLINQRLNKSSTNMIALHFASLGGKDYIRIKSVNAYSKNSLSGCMKRNGRVICFYNVNKLHNQDLIDQNNFNDSFSLLDDYREIPYDNFLYIISTGDVFRILPDGDLIGFSAEEYENVYDKLDFDNKKK